MSWCLVRYLRWVKGLAIYSVNKDACIAITVVILIVELDKIEHMAFQGVSEFFITANAVGANSS